MEQLAEGGPQHTTKNLFGEPRFEGAGCAHTAHVVYGEGVVVEVGPVPLDFVVTVVDATAYEKLCRTFALDGLFAVSSFDGCVLGQGFPSYLGGNDRCLGDAVDGGGHGLNGFDVLAADVNASVFVDGGIDQAGFVGGFGREVWCLLSWCAGTGAVKSPNLIMI